MAFIEYNAARGGLRPGSAKLTKTHLILSPDLVDKISSYNIQVAYDPDTENLRLKPVESGGLKISGGKLQSKGFCNYFLIKKKGLFDAKWDDDEKAIYVLLKSSN
ncbi:MAG: hypothetical protein K9L17_12170 [Clostridiales bacterium]|nr:hypothetical protein [Clostridiales bacterium]MCF8023440.1 hypothetical protein [Clostridiales bacterium]